MPLPSGQLVTPVGQRSDGTMRSLLIDDSDRLHVVDSLGAFNASVSQQVVNGATGAGTVVLTATAPGATEVWHIQTMGVMNLISACTLVEVHLRISGSDFIVFHDTAPAANRWGIWNGHLTFTSDAFIRASFYGCVAGDSIILTYAGYKALLSV